MTGEREISYLAAASEAIQESLREDERVIYVGEDLGLYSRNTEIGARVRATPISENGFTGMCIGAAMMGLRPIVELTIASFVYLAADQIINQAAKLRYMSGGQTTVPIVFRASMWYDGSNAAHHSDRPYPMFMNQPGLKVVAPATPADAKGLLKAAVRDDDPVLVFEDNNLWGTKGPVPEGDHVEPIGLAAVRREGSDVTVITVAGSLIPALEAAETLAGKGISVEVIDVRTLAPLDERTLCDAVARTGRAVIVDPAHRVCSAASEISAVLAEHVFDALRAPIRRVTTPMIPIPFAPAMERPLYPNAEKIVAAVRAVCAHER
ncbi:MAG TPA: transketolase C-terminal domain-containing protein [Acidimicrobiales bacterium]